MILGSGTQTSSLVGAGVFEVSFTSVRENANWMQLLLLEEPSDTGVKRHFWEYQEANRKKHIFLPPISSAVSC